MNKAKIKDMKLLKTRLYAEENSSVYKIDLTGYDSSESNGLYFAIK